MSHLIHRHLIVTAFLKEVPTSVEAGEDWLRRLVKLVNMEILMDAKAIYCEDLGNEGLTAMVGLTTSHSSIHFWGNVEKPFANFDLYSCAEFDEKTVFDHLNEFGIISANYMVINRNDGINHIESCGVYHPHPDVGIM